MSKIYYFLSFFLIFLGIPAISAVVPTIENLNTLHLWPSKAVPHNPFITIPTFFEKIKKGKWYDNGSLQVVENAQHPHWEFKKGLPSGFATPIFIHSGPRDDTLGRLTQGRHGHGLRCTNAWVKNRIINAPFITFDYFFDADEFDFGQGINIDALHMIYSKTVDANPKAPFIIAGTCIGAKVSLEYAAHFPAQQIKAMILESPFLDVKQVSKNWARSYLGWLPFAENDEKSSIIKSILSWYFPQCTAFDQPHADIKNIRSDLPIFIAHLHNDNFYSDADIARMITDLRANGNDTIYLLVIEDKKLSHGRLNNKKCFAQATSAFLAAHGIVHDTILAQEGQQLLAVARQNAQQNDPSKWQTVKD